LTGQFIVNFLNLADHALNFLLLGDSDETVSARTARARNAGQKWAAWACATLTFLAKLTTFGKSTQDHCDYALDKSIRPNSGEIWNWSLNEINIIPISEVIVIDNGSVATSSDGARALAQASGQMLLIKLRNPSDQQFLRPTSTYIIRENVK
jgi:hypothetical protein